MMVLPKNLYTSHEPLFQRRRCSIEIESCMAGTFIIDPSRNVHFGEKPEKHLYFLAKEEKKWKKDAFKANHGDMTYKYPMMDKLEFVAQNKSQNASAEFPVCAHDEDMSHYVHVQTKQAKRYRPGVKAKLSVCWKKLFGKRQKPKAPR